MLRLPREVSPLFQEWLAEHEPGRADKIMTRLRDMHGGKDYSSRWHERMRGQGAYADLIAHRMKLAIRRHGLGTSLPPLDCSSFAVPGRAKQLKLL